MCGISHIVDINYDAVFVFIVLYKQFLKLLLKDLVNTL